MENKVSAVDFIKKGWEIFKKNPGVNIAIVVAIFIISIISGTIASFLSGPVREIYNAFDSLVIQTLVSIFVFSYAILSVRSGGKDANTLVSKALSKIDLKMWMNFAIYMIIVFAIPAVFVALLSLIAWFNPMAMAAYALLAPVIFLVLLTYAILVSIFLAWGYYVMIDENVSAVEAIKKSVKLAKGKVSLIFLVVLIVAAMNVLGAIPFMLGLLITVPVSMFTSAALYEYLSGGIEPVLSEEDAGKEDKEGEDTEDEDEREEESDDINDEDSDENAQEEQNENLDSNGSDTTEEGSSEDNKTPS